MSLCAPLFLCGMGVLFAGPVCLPCWQAKAVFLELYGCLQTLSSALPHIFYGRMLQSQEGQNAE